LLLGKFEQQETFKIEQNSFFKFILFSFIITLIAHTVSSGEIPATDKLSRGWNVTYDIKPPISGPPYKAPHIRPPISSPPYQTPHIKPPTISRPHIRPSMSI